MIKIKYTSLTTVYITCLVTRGVVLNRSKRTEMHVTKAIIG